jgi:hypothetical protein
LASSLYTGMIKETFFINSKPVELRTANCVIRVNQIAVNLLWFCQSI